MTQMSKEYATALFMLASEENCRKEIADALAVMKDAFEQHSEYAELLSSPAVSIGERLEIIDAAFSSLHEYAVSFLKLLCERMLARSFTECVSEYNNLLAASSGISTATVTSAVELTANQQSTLRQKLEKMCGHTVIIETSVDASVLGGMIIEVDGKVIDASLRRRLSDVKDVISR